MVVPEVKKRAIKCVSNGRNWFTTALMAVADVSAQGRVVSVLEGGYSLQALASGSAAHVRALQRR